MEYILQPVDNIDLIMHSHDPAPTKPIMFTFPHGIATLFCLFMAGASLHAEPTTAPMFAADIIPIGVIQGPVEEGEIGHTFESSRINDKVLVQGVIHETIMVLDRKGAILHSFFLQNTKATADGDPFTSDGILVFAGKTPEIRNANAKGEYYTPKVGDEIVLGGKVRELFFQTRMTYPSLHQIVREGVDLDKALPAFEARPPDDLDEAYRYWEMHEGMRAMIPAGCIVQQGLKVRKKFGETETVLIHPEHPVAQRRNPIHRRVFRDYHPLDDNAEQRFDNRNGYRISIANLGLRGTQNDVTAKLTTSHTFDVLQHPVFGAVYQFQDTYSIQPMTEPVFRRPPNLPPVTSDRKVSADDSLLLATLNLENLYDHRDDPDDPCDAADDSGSGRIAPPFDYLPSSEADYQRRIRKIAAQIIQAMQAPHIILIQEAEDQDLLTFRHGRSLPKPDGRPDVLQELAWAVHQLGGPMYEVANDRDGADYRGITSAFMFRSDRVEMLEPDARHFLLGENPDFTYAGRAARFNHDVQNPKCLNAEIPENTRRDASFSGPSVFARSVQIGQFRVWRRQVGDRGPHRNLYALSNHFASRPNDRIGLRREQARFNAALITRILEDNPNAWVLAGGDLNTFPRPDEPLPEEPGDQLGALYDAGLYNMHDRWIKDDPASAYTYVYKGQAGTLDQLFLSDALNALVSDTWVAHYNADWSDHATNSLPYAVSDHDPAMVVVNWPPERGDTDE